MSDEDEIDDIDIEELFESIYDDIEAEAKSEATIGSTLKNTVTPSRLALVESQKASSLLKYISEFKSGRGEWVAPATELILLDDDFDVVSAAFERIITDSFALALSLLGMVCWSHLESSRMT